MKHFLLVSCLFISIGTFSQVDADSRLYEAIDNNELPNVKTSLADGARISGWDESFLSCS